MLSASRIRGLSFLLLLTVLCCLFLGQNPARAGTDVVFANSHEPNRVCLNNGPLGYTCSDVSADTRYTSGVALGHLDDDLDLDAVFANWGQVGGGEVNRYCLGDGLGGFSCADVSVHTGASTGVGLGFVNGDEILDAVFSNSGGENRLCVGVGGGLSFICSRVSTDTFVSKGVALGDFNSDQNVDVVFANWYQKNRVCLGDGFAGFTCSDVSTDEYGSTAVAIGKFNNDAYPDLVFANMDNRNRYCLGDGVGGFTCGDLFMSPVDSTDVDVGWVDSGNTDLDLVFSNANEPNVVCYGNGIGGFLCLNVSVATNPTNAVALGFGNEDDYTDVVFANYSMENSECLGDGSINFACDWVSADTFQTTGVAVGQVRKQMLFADGFESGDTSVWSISVH